MKCPDVIAIGPCHRSVSVAKCISHLPGAVGVVNLILHCLSNEGVLRLILGHSPDGLKILASIVYKPIGELAAKDGTFGHAYTTVTGANGDHVRTFHDTVLAYLFDELKAAGIFFRGGRKLYKKHILVLHFPEPHRP